jgi:ADP-ribosylation factor related protein 1
MFHLASAIYSQLTSREQYSVLILGLDNAGKTTLLEELKALYLNNYTKLPAARIIPTVGQNVATLQVDGMLLKFWDVGGQDALRELWSEYYEQAHAIVFVVDSCDPERLRECQDTLSAIFTDGRVEGMPVLMLANKQDLDVPGKLDLAQIKDVFNKIAESMNANDSRVLPVSARTGEGVPAAVNWLKERLVLNRSNRPPIYKS